MKKTTRRIKTWKYVVSLTVSTLCILTAIFVEITAANFAWKSAAIHMAETTGKTVTYNAGGAITWTEAQVEDYKNAVASKKELINTNDVAKFFSDLAGSTTGRIFRWLVPLVIVPAWVYISAKYWYAAVSILTNRHKKWKAHREAEKAKQLEEKQAETVAEAETIA